MRNTLFTLLLFISFFSNAQMITTIAGTGPTGFGVGSYGGDGGPATAANLYNPAIIAFDSHGNLYIPDIQNGRVRKVNTSGIITTVAGGGTSALGGPATAAELGLPDCVAFDALGNMYIADQSTSRIDKVDPSGIITGVAGNGLQGFSGDGGPATNAELNNPSSIAFDAAGNMYIGDWGNNRLRKVNPVGTITTVAGGGASYTQGMPATAVSISPAGVTFDHSGNMLVADASNNRIDKIDNAGIITTFAGTGSAGYSGDGGPATAVAFKNPGCLVYDYSGNLFLTDENNQAVRKIDTAGNISTIAGNSTAGFTGDGGPATAAQFDEPDAIAFDASGNLYVSDLWNNRIRKISLAPSLIPEISSVADFSIFPNPASTELNITSTENIDNIAITNLIGQTVYVNKYTTEKVQVDVSVLPAGIYFVKVDNGSAGLPMTKKFVKE